MNLQNTKRMKKLCEKHNIDIDCSIIDSAENLKRDMRNIPRLPFKFTNKEWYDLIVKIKKTRGSEELKKIVQQIPVSFALVDKPSYALCMYAVRQDCMNIRFVKNPTEEICVTAMKKNIYSFLFIERQNEKLCRMAYKADPDLILIFDDEYQELFI